MLKELFSWFIELLMDQRGEIGDLDEGTDETLEKEEKEDKETSEHETIIIKAEKEESEEEKAKVKKETDKQKADEDLKKEFGTLKENYERLSKHKTDLDKAISELRRENKSLKGTKSEKDEPLSDSQLLKILEENPDDPEIQLRMLKHLAQQVAKGEVDKGVSAAEINRKSAQFTEFLEDKYPTLFEEGSDIRRDVDKTKEDLGLVEHPFGDFFAVAVNVLTDLPELLDYAFNEGQDKAVKGKGEEKRKESIAGGKLPPSKEKSGGERGLSESALETANQMELTPGQRKAYEKLVGRKPRIVSVED